MVRMLTLERLPWSADVGEAGRRRYGARTTAARAGRDGSATATVVFPGQFLRHGGAARRGGEDGVVGLSSGGRNRDRKSVV